MSFCAAKVMYLHACGYVCLRALIKDNRMDMACSTNESIIFACRRKLVNYELERMEMKTYIMLTIIGGCL